MELDSDQTEYNQPHARPRIRRAYVLISLGVLILVFSGAITKFIGGASQLGGIYISESQHSFVRAEQKGGSFSHTFRIFNLRPSALTLKAEPDCGCTHVSWKKTTIKPFGWADLTAAMDAPRDKAPPKSVSVALKTNRTQRPYAFVFLKS